MGEVDCKCGIVVAHSLHDAYNMMQNGVQHRGHDAAGIFCLKEGGAIDGVRWQGRVKDFSRAALERILDGGNIFIGEVRYSTNRGKTQTHLVRGALPRYIGGKITSIYEFPYLPHMVVRGAKVAAIHNGHFRGFVPPGEDTDTDGAVKFYAVQEKDGVERIIRTFPTAYAAGILDSKNDFVEIFKDRFGIRPLWIGEKDGKIVAASEDNAITCIGGDPTREVSPGEIITIYRNGAYYGSKEVFSKEERRPKRPCFFERLYLASRESTANGIHNKDTRRRGGVALVHELLDSGFDTDSIDFVSYIPNAPIDYARAVADRLHKPLWHVFYKIDPKRAFLGPDESHREESIKHNLCIDDQYDLSRKRGLFVDDSIVRFNNARDAAIKLDERGIIWKGLLIATPPLGLIVDNVPCGCEGGVDMPPNDNFAIRRYNNYQAMAISNGWNFIYYLSKEKLAERVLRRPLYMCCARCIGEPDPVSPEELGGLQQEVDRAYEKFNIIQSA